MKALVIIGHQKRGSFCHAIAETAMATLSNAGHEVIYHDLYEEQFDPILPHEEVPKDARPDAIVRQHCAEVAAADGYIVIHPNWWGQPPAILKGWLDRVFRQGVVSEFGEDGSVTGLLAGKRALVFTTSNTPRDVELALFGDPLENLWKNCVFGFCGVQTFLRRNFESIVMSTPQERKAWLDDVRQMVGEMFGAAE